jgi:small subunit ribosomal protein S15
MSLEKEEKIKIVKDYGRSENDTGSAEVQIALLTTDINKLTDHFKTHKHDHHSRRGLMRKVSLRRKLLGYLKNKNIEHYRKIISQLKLRG